MKLSLLEVAEAIDGVVDSKFENVEVSSVSFDTRSMEQGALFVPLIAKNDGHNYLKNALEKGASATLWQKDHEKALNVPAIIVDDTLKAMQKLAKYYLKKINPKVVAVTGSNGKTTTKDMIYAILSRKFNVQKTYANFNNQIGVPMTILSMEENTEILVVEMGMDHFLELDFLSKLVQPDIAVITMIGEAHIEFFKTRDKIADAKMEITHGLKKNGILVYNGDESLLNERAKKIDQKIKTFGLNKTNMLYADNILSFEKETSFEIKKLHESFKIPMIGEYNVNNALAAISVGRIFKLSILEIKEALLNLKITENRTQWIETKKGFKILSDVYNSNPTAAKKVIQAFSKVKTPGKRIVVLGDMLELGEQEKAMHESLANVLFPNEIDEVYLYGSVMYNLYKKLRFKFTNDKLHWYDNEDKQRLNSDLKLSLNPEDIVLIKGSHGMHLEDVLVFLQK